MIYTRFGSQVELLHDCGDRLPGQPPAVRLVEVRYLDDGRTGFQLMHCLKADGGAAEISVAVDGLKYRFLERKALQEALKDAE